MEQQIDSTEIQHHLGFYNSLLQLNGYGKSAKRLTDLGAIYEMLISIRATVNRDLALLESQIPDTPRQHLNLPWKPKRTVLGYSVKQLTQREQQVLALFARGCSYNETAQLLDCQLATVQTHAKHIYKKLNVHSRAEAVFEARQSGLPGM